jgi:hypothetical protein
MILFTTGESSTPDGTLAECGQVLGSPGSGWVFAAQGALDADGGGMSFPDENAAPENAGLAFRLGATTKVLYQLHYVNTTGSPILKESWSNLHYVAAEDVEQHAEPITFFGGLGMAVPPHTTQVLDISCSAPSQSIRVTNLWPHQHAHGTRFSAYKVAAGGDRSLIYETYDWEEPDQLFFDSTHVNPEADRDAGRAGGATGPLRLEAGDRIDYECEITNTTEGTLRFANEAYTAEMCNLFGSYTPSVGGTWLCASQ